MLNKLIATYPTWFTLPIRLALGVVMIAHGSQKVLGSFNGPGFKTFVAGDTPFNFMRPAWFWLGAAALSELIGGLLVALGDRKSTRLNSSHLVISYAVFCLKQN